MFIVKVTRSYGRLLFEAIRSFRVRFPSFSDSLSKDLISSGRFVFAEDSMLVYWLYGSQTYLFAVIFRNPS